MLVSRPLSFVDQVYQIHEIKHECRAVESDLYVAIVLTVRFWKGRTYNQTFKVLNISQPEKKQTKDHIILQPSRKCHAYLVKF